MIELYVVLAIINGQPNIKTFADMNTACASIEAQPDARIYKEVIDRKSNATFTEGSCKAVQAFTPK